MLKMLTWLSSIFLYRSILLDTFLWELYMSVHVFQYKGCFTDVCMYSWDEFVGRCYRNPHCQQVSYGIVKGDILFPLLLLCPLHMDPGHCSHVSGHSFSSTPLLFIVTSYVFLVFFIVLRSCLVSLGVPPSWFCSSTAELHYCQLSYASLSMSFPLHNILLRMLFFPLASPVPCLPLSHFGLCVGVCITLYVYTAPLPVSSL